MTIDDLEELAKWCDYRAECSRNPFGFRRQPDPAFIQDYLRFERIATLLRHRQPVSAPVSDEMVERAEQIVDAVRAQNWKVGGALAMDRDKATEVVSTALSAAIPGGMAWRPIETAPKTGCPLILYGHWKQFHGTEHEAESNHVNCGHYANGWVCEGRYDEQFIATHWMPLPTPPTAQEE